MTDIDESIITILWNKSINNNRCIGYKIPTYLHELQSTLKYNSLKTKQNNTAITVKTTMTITINYDVDDVRSGWSTLTMMSDTSIVAI